jgi:hypothetical protein
MLCFSSSVLPVFLDYSLTFIANRYVLTNNSKFDLFVPPNLVESERCIENSVFQMYKRNVASCRVIF